jgi:hypothetical protein
VNRHVKKTKKKGRKKAEETAAVVSTSHVKNTENKIQRTVMFRC